jgi:hypothetical protein
MHSPGLSGENLSAQHDSRALGKRVPDELLTDIQYAMPISPQFAWQLIPAFGAGVIGEIKCYANYWQLIIPIIWAMVYSQEHGM